MASIIRHKRGWRAQVCKKGSRASGVFATKAMAEAWATRKEAEFLESSAGLIPDKTFADLLDRYAREVSGGKRGSRWELLRLALIGRDPVGLVNLRELKPSDLAAWRDRRLSQVSAASVLREWNLLAHACNVARKEWGWLRESPLADLRKPPKPEARHRRVTDAEIDAILHALGYERGTSPENVTQTAAVVFLFALASAMRAGEIVNLKWSDIDGKVAKLPTSKTGARKVPLTPEAIEVLGWLPKGDGKVFDITSAQLDALWRKGRDRAMIDDMHFHDSRAEALTRLSKRMDVMTLARISGHKDIRLLYSTYYREGMEDVAERLGA